MTTQISVTNKITGDIYRFNMDSRLTNAGMGCQLGCSYGIRGHLYEVKRKVAEAETAAKAANRYSSTPVGVTEPKVVAEVLKYLTDYPESLDEWHNMVLIQCRMYGAVMLSAPINYYTPNKPENNHSGGAQAQMASTIAFIKWLKRNKQAIVVSSPIFRNTLHNGKNDLSLCQAWVVIAHKVSHAHKVGRVLSGVSLMAPSKEAAEKLIEAEQGFALTDNVYFKASPTDTIDVK